VSIFFRDRQGPLFCPLAPASCNAGLLPGQIAEPVQPSAPSASFEATEAAAASELETPEHFICPITLAVMREPMMDRHGHTFEAFAIAKWLSHNRRCPINRKPLWPDFLRPNLTLHTEIDEWRRHVEVLTQNSTGPSVSPRDARRPEPPPTVSSTPPPREADHPRARKPREFLPFSSPQADRPRPWWASFLLCGAQKKTCAA